MSDDNDLAPDEVVDVENVDHICDRSLGPPPSGWTTTAPRFGLCRTLAREWWHVEGRPGWKASSTCPGPVDDQRTPPLERKRIVGVFAMRPGAAPRLIAPLPRAQPNETNY